jgi:hypothetical protein
MEQPNNIVVSIAVFRVKRIEQKTAHPTPSRFLEQLAYDLYTFCLALTEQTEITWSNEVEFSPAKPHNQDVIRAANALLRKRGFELELRWCTDQDCLKSGQKLVIKIA